VITAGETTTTVAGITFWVVLMAAYLALILFALSKIVHSSLSTGARTRWVWLVVLAPMLGIVLWFVAGRPADARRQPSTDRT
jgi:hypothetical protein